MRAIETRYTGPSNVKGSRIIVTAGDVRKVYGIGKLEDAAITSNRHMDMCGEWAHIQAALMLCTEMKWDNVQLVQGETKRGYVFVMVKMESKTGGVA